MSLDSFAKRLSFMKVLPFADGDLDSTADRMDVMGFYAVESLPEPEEKDDGLVTLLLLEVGS